MSTLVLGIAGGTGSGKSSIARRLTEGLPGDAVLTIDHDSYYKDQAHLPAEERPKVNFDHPDTLDNDLLVQHLTKLRSGEPVEIPRYDFRTHTRQIDTRHANPAPIILLEGILTFVDERIRKLLDIKIFVDTDSDIRVFRRIRRDIEQRGRTFQSIREQYYATVRPMHLQFVEPSKRWADLIIPEGGDNTVAIDLILGKLRDVLARRRAN